MYDLGGVAESTHSAHRRFDRFWKARMDVLNDSYIGKYKIGSCNTKRE